MAVIGKDPIPTAFDAINSGGCNFRMQVSSIRLELWQCDPDPWDGCTTGTGYESQIVVIPIPEPTDVFPFPLENLPVPLIDAGLPEGEYARRLIVISGDGTAIQVSGIERVHLVHEPGSLQADLLRHRGRWMRLGVADYTYDGVWLCSCPPEYQAVARVTVRDSRIAEITPENPDIDSIPEPERFLVENVFDLLQEGITRDAARISVDYDELFGYPETLVITYDYMTGEHVGAALRDLTPLQP